METEKTGKIRVHSEMIYLLAIFLLALAVAMLTAADFGISMIVAPAYLLSLKTGFLTFGQAEYVIQCWISGGFCRALTHRSRRRAVWCCGCGS